MKLVFLYLSLVAIPLAGVVGILRLGETLTPPTSIGGAWRIEANPPEAGEPACGLSLSLWVQQPVLTISQSGSHLLLTLNNQQSTTLVGEIEGATVVADESVSRRRAQANAAEAQAAAAHLEASVDRQAEPGRLQGVLTTTQCSRRTVIPFTAIRQPDPGQ
jgi:hypothetical protein